MDTKKCGCGPSPSRFLDWIRPLLSPMIDVIWAGLLGAAPYQKKRGYLREQIFPDKVELEVASSVELATTV